MKYSDELGQKQEISLSHVFTLVEGDLRPFYISKVEVTQRLYFTIMGMNPSCFRVGGDIHPVERISWYDAIMFCNKASLMCGLTPCYSINGSTNINKWGQPPIISDPTWDNAKCDFSANGLRLPTADEWICAARGGNPFNEHMYSGSYDINYVAWYKENSNDETHDVGQKGANELGIFDMSGNVYEWCWDQDYTDKTKRCNMGGSYLSGEDACAVDAKFYGVASSSYYFVGMRLATSNTENLNW